MRVNKAQPTCTKTFAQQKTRTLVRTFWRFAGLLCLLALLGPTGLLAQNFTYVNNQSGVSNSIASFSVDTGGVATSLGTISTGGTGAPVACAGIDRITTNLASNLLFVSNGGDQSISVFHIAPATGTLSAVAGSPFASGLTLDSCSGISLAATPDGHFLMASSNGQIKSFSIAPTGALSLSSTASLLPSPMVGMKISGDGRFLAVSHQATVSVFTISAVDGSLTAVAGSPFAKGGTGLVGGVEFNCDGTFLYAAEGGATSSITDAWSVAASGALTPITGSPFTATGSDSNVVFLTPDNTILYQSNQGSKDLNTFTVNPDGTLTSIGLASIAAGHTPAGLASDNSGLFLFGADDAFGLAVFNIVPGAVPTLVGDTAIAGAGQIQGIAAYPPRSCAHTDFSVTQTASPNPVTAGNQITYNITVTNNGPSAASVAINDLLPRNFVTFVSCTPGPGGVCDKGAGLNRTITFASLASGQSGTATIVAASVSTLLNGDTISNTASASNSSAVDTNPANNSSTTNVTVTAPLAASKLTVANATGSYFGTTNLSATLTRVLNGAVVAGRTVTFSLNGVVMGTAVTNASGIATLSNVSLAGINAGTYPVGVSANFAGDSQFSGTSGSAILTVNKLPLTVTTQNASRFFGDANPVFTYVITGFVNNETTAVVSGAASCSTSASATSVPNSYTIACSIGTLSATNYSFVFVNAILTVNPAPLVLAANSVSRFYGDANPALPGTVVGLKNGNQATATFSTAAVATSPVGSYPILGTVIPGSGFVATNYSISSSGSVTVNPAPLTATAANATRVYGDPNPTFTGTITGLKNGDVVTATFSSAADPTSPVGTYPITATLSGSPTVISNYTVTSNSGTLTVTPAALSVTAGNASRFYGDANPAFTGTVTGIKNADNITATYASTAVAASAVGTFPIVPTLVDPTAKLGNYTVTSNNGTLTVNPAALSVSAASVSRLYGDANPLFTGTITGIKNGDNITATYASIADPISAVGTFAIVPTLADPTAKLGNYSVISTNGILTVSPAPLSVVGTSVSRIYGDLNPAFTGTITGIKNADNITATFASTATAASPVGGYPITPSLVDPGAKLGNYSVTSTNGTLTVSPAALTVTGTNASRLYGDSNPAFTGTITGIKNGDNITATFDSAATAASAVGSYAIVGTLVDPTAKLGNYSVTSNNGTLTVNPAALTVTAADATRVYGDANPAFTGTITGIKNGDNITATYASPAVAGSGVGAYAIIPSLVDPTAKLTNYIVTANNGSLSVTPAALTVNAGNASRAYGDPNPAFAGTIIGLKNGDVITATYASTAGATSPVGTYPVTAALVDPTAKLGNYTVTINGGALTVSPAALTVTAANASRLYGDANPAFAGTIAGLKNGDAISATYSSAADPTSSVGPYAIVPTLADPTLKLGNYSVSSVNGTLTVSPAALTVTAANASRLFGAANPAFTGTIVGIKNGDSITATYATRATATSSVGTYPIVPTLTDPTIKLGNYTITSSNGTLTVFGTPAGVSVTPSGGTGTSQAFQLTYSDPDGFGSISATQAIINTTLTYTGSCAVFYTASTQSLAIINDAGDAFSAPAKLGVPGTLQNSQCSIDVGASSASGVGNNLTLNLAATFKAGFTGTDSIFMQVQNKFGVNSGWQNRGTWTPAAPLPPSPVSVTPTGGTGISEVFHLTYSDPSGFASISATQTIINGTLTYTGACAVFYQVSSQTLAIINDAGSAFSVPAKLGVAGTLQNSQCSIDVGASSASGVGNNLTLNLAVTFTPSFVGVKSIYMQLQNKFGLTSGWQNRGAWAPAAAPAPSPISVTPNAGTGTSQVFQLTYSDPSGFGSISATQTIINTTLTYTGSCAVFYTASTQSLAIINDAGDAFSTPAKLGVAGTLQNSQCSIDVGASSASGVGNNLTLNLAVNFKPGFVGTDGIFMQVQNTFGANSGWQNRGTWIPAGALPPSPVSVTPSVGTGVSQLFQLTYSDPSGFGSISATQTIINSTLTYTGSCAAFYTASTQSLAIINDAGDAFSAPAKLGVAGTLQNSQCSIDVGASSVSGVGSNLTLNLAVTFKPGFAGTKNIFMQVQNKFGLNSGWQNRGTWTLP
jgi:hypothetical protein